MKRLGVIVLAIALAAPPAIASSDPMFLVVPGRRIGPVTIGMHLNAVEEILGHPSRVDSDGRTQWYEWKSPDNRLRSIAVETLQDTVVLISLAHDPRYRTREGWGDGDTLEAVERVWGRAPSVIHLSGFGIAQYRKKGIAFVTDGTRHVTGIVIAPAL
ncbi:MAG TPA: hypothetical protein VGZ23_17275 [bacterium]|nr:hypothetical protein [bacterium]